MSSNEINKQAKLSEHFTLAELCKTSVKTADGNMPSHEHIENLRRLCRWLERLPRGTYWLHFAVRPQGNRHKVAFLRA